MEGGKLIRLKDKSQYMTCEEVFNQFKNFLYKTAQHWTNKYDFNDIFSAASFALVKAYKSYDTGKDILFMTYLATIVNNEILMLNRREKKYLGTVSLNIKVQSQKDNSEVEMVDLIAEDKDYEEEIINKMAHEEAHVEIMSSINKLNDRDKKIIQSYYFEDKTQLEICKELKISQSYVSRLLRKIPKRIKNDYERGNKLNNKERRITKEQLLNECKENGYSKERIAKKYGCKPGTIDFYYYKWGVRRELSQDEKPEMSPGFEEGLRKIEEESKSIPKAQVEPKPKIYEQVKEAKHEIIKTVKPVKAEEEPKLKVANKTVILDIEGTEHTFHIEIAEGKPFMKITPKVNDCNKCPGEVMEAYNTFMKLLEL